MSARASLIITLAFIALVAAVVYYQTFLLPTSMIREYIETERFQDGWELQSVSRQGGVWTAQVEVNSAAAAIRKFDLRILAGCPDRHSGFWDRFPKRRFEIKARGMAALSRATVECHSELDTIDILIESLKD